MTAARKRGERRRTQKLVFLERRKGAAWMYGEIGACVLLLAFLVWKLLK